ncbi:MAG: DinB family protein [Pyrinomonadaceae bacterium]
MNMTERIEQVTDDLSKTADDAKATFGGLSAEQLNWKPAEKSWSIGQCLEHIIKTNHEFDAELVKIAAGKRENSFWENYSPFTGLAGRFLVNAVSSDSTKAKAPSERIVPPSEIDSKIVERFVMEISETNKKVAACAAADLKKTVVTSPFLSVMTYRLDDALTVLAEHTKRHIRQAKRVMETEGFPT